MEFVDLMSKFIGDKPANTAITEFLEDRGAEGQGTVADVLLGPLSASTLEVISGSGVRTSN